MRRAVQEHTVNGGKQTCIVYRFIFTVSILEMF
jgi:hypothetical protein